MAAPVSDFYRACQFPKTRPRVLDKREAVAARAKDGRDMRAAVKKRDKGKCRACGKSGVHVHHLIFRSQGGKHEAANAVLLCKICHQDVHARLLLPVFRAVNPAGTLKWERVTVQARTIR